MKEDNRKWFLVTVVLFGVLMTWIMGEFFTFLGGYFNLHIKAIFGIFPAYYSVSALINLALVVYLIRKKAVESFATETVTEVKKVTWPSTPETAKSTGVVIVVVIICSFILWVYDSVITKLLKLLLAPEK